MATRASSTATGAYGNYFLTENADWGAATQYAFGQLLMQLTKVVEAEARLEKPDVDVCSAAFGLDLREAERLRDRLFETACDVLLIPSFEKSDHGLRRLSHLLIRVLHTDDSAQRRQYLNEAAENRDVFDIPGHCFAARLARRHQDLFFQLLDRLAELREFGGIGLAACASSPDTATPESVQILA